MPFHILNIFDVCGCIAGENNMSILHHWIFIEETQLQ